MSQRPAWATEQGFVSMGEKHNRRNIESWKRFRKGCFMAARVRAARWKTGFLFSLFLSVFQGELGAHRAQTLAPSLGIQEGSCLNSW